MRIILAGGVAKSLKLMPNKSKEGFGLVLKAELGSIKKNISHLKKKGITC